MHEKRNANRWKEPPWTARRASGYEAVGGVSVGALVSGDCLAVPGARCFPEATCGHGRGRSCRSAHQAAPGARRVQGGGGRAAQECAGRRPGPCRLARVAGRGRVGVGNERHAFANTEIPDASHQLRFPVGETRLAALENLYLQPASEAGRFISRCSSASLSSAAGPLRGHRPVEAQSALHHLIDRASFDTRRHIGAHFNRVLQRSPR